MSPLELINPFKKSAGNTVYTFICPKKMLLFFGLRAASGMLGFFWGLGSVASSNGRAVAQTAEAVNLFVISSLSPSKQTFSHFPCPNNFGGSSALSAVRPLESPVCLAGGGWPGGAPGSELGRQLAAEGPCRMAGTRLAGSTRRITQRIMIAGQPRPPTCKT
jgi:hypothetical protein